MPKSQLRALAIILLLVFAATEVFLAYNTLYTEGEVMQGLYYVLTGLNALLLVVILWRPAAGLWCTVGLGALLVPWQAYEARKWTVLHEEVIGIVRFAEQNKRPDGNYPPSLDGYGFKREWTADHISYRSAGSAFRIDYFLDDPGISYWYEPTTGFEYYPD